MTIKKFITGFVLAVLCVSPASAQVIQQIGPQAIPPQILLPLSNTWTGANIFTGGLKTSGNLSGTTVSTTGFNIQGAAATYTENTTGGTIATEAANGILAPVFTLGAAGSETITQATTLYLAAPTCTNGAGTLTCTNLDSLVTAGRVVFSTGGTWLGGTVNINNNSNFTVGIGTGTTNATVTIGSTNNTTILGSTTLNLTGIASTSAGQTGTVCLGAGSTLTYDTTTTCLLSLEEMKDKHGEIDPAKALAETMLLKPFWFTWKRSTPEWIGDKQTQPGLGAHQTASVDKRLAAYDPKGNLHGVRYQELTAVLVADIQQQQHEIDALKAQLKALRK